MSGLHELTSVWIVKKNVTYANSQYVLSAIGPTNMILELVHCFVFLIITDLILKYIVMYE